MIERRLKTMYQLVFRMVFSNMKDFYKATYQPLQIRYFQLVQRTLADRNITEAVLVNFSK